MHMDNACYQCLQPCIWIMPATNACKHAYAYIQLKKGVVPFEWKEANIIPLFKKCSRNKSENYSELICKLLERFIKDHILDFLVRHNLLNPCQHVFLKGVMLNKYVFGRIHQVDRRGITSRHYLLRIFRRFLTKSHIKDYYLN